MATATTSSPRLLYINVLLIATCGLIYELLAGTLGSYLLGDSVTQFSLVIGLYLSAMGVGAWLSRRLDNDLAKRFVEIELAVAVVGGASAPVLFLAFAVFGYQSIRRIAGAKPRVFDASLTELEKDRQQLRGDR